MGCACGIDVHAHVVPENFPASLTAPGLAGWPSMAPAHDCHRHVMIDGRVYRTVSDRCWSVARRVADMPEMGLSLQVVSPMPELFSYWLPNDAASELLCYINDVIAEMVSASDGRLAGLGAVPLQDMDLAIRQLHRVRRDLGMPGVEIGSNVLGRPIGSPEFDAFFAECAALDACVFVHAVRPEMGRVAGPAPLQQALGYPSEIGLAAASVITGRLMERHPGLRIAFSHGGGTLGLLLPRLEQATPRVSRRSATAITGSPSRPRRASCSTTRWCSMRPTLLARLVELVRRRRRSCSAPTTRSTSTTSTPVARIEAALPGSRRRSSALTHGNARRFLALPA